MGLDEGGHAAGLRLVHAAANGYSRAMSWSRGDHVIMRSRPQGHVGYTFPAIVVRESADLIVLFQPSGTVCKRRTGERGGPNGRNMVRWDGSYRDAIADTSTLHAWVPDDPFWVIRRWDGLAIDGWYINLAEPWRRTAIGFDTLDQILDVVVEPDRATWRWKDEDELAWAVETGRYTSREAEQIRQHGDEALARMASKRPPLHDDWSELEPDAAWPVPVLPAGWEVLDDEASGPRP
jgi:hypothetical protein